MLEERFASHLRARDANGNYITSDEKLLNYLQDPGTIPSILVLGEVERRQVENKQRQQMEAQAAGPMPTVKDQAMMQQANAQNMMTGGIDNLGAQRPDTANVPQPTQMTAQQKANTPGLPVLAKAGGYVPEFKEGGVVGYQLGGNVNIPDFNRQNVLNYPGFPPYYPESERRSLSDQFTFPGMDKNQMDLFKEKARLEDKIRKRENVTFDDVQNLKEITSIVEKGGKGGYEPGDAVDKTPTTLPTLQEDLPIGETTTNKAKLQDQESVFEGARLDTGKRDTSKFDELMMEDPDVYRERMQRERREAVGESPFGKAIEEEAARSKKDQGRQKTRLTGEFLMYLGDAVGKQIPGQALDLQPAIKNLEKNNQALLDMVKDDRKYMTELQKLDYADKKAEFDYGVNSEERARINNQKVGLEAIKNQVEYDKMANDLKKAKISATAYGRYLAASLGRDKLGYQVVSDINAEMQKDPRYMPIYQQIMVIDNKKNPTKEDLQEKERLENKIEVEKARRFNEYAKFAGLDQNALSQVDKGLIKPPEGFNVVPLDK